MSIVINQTIPPKGFTKLPTKGGTMTVGALFPPPDPKLYYQVEKDNGVVITGDLYACTFRLELSDGSIIHGGISPDRHVGEKREQRLFGDRRWVKDKGKGKSHPLRWIEREVVEAIGGLLPPEERRRKITLPPGKVLKAKNPTPTGISPSVQNLLDTYQSKHLEAVSTRTLVEALQEEIVRKDKKYSELQNSFSQIQQKFATVSTQINEYRTKALDAENLAKQEVRVMQEEYENKRTTRRLQVEAVKSDSFEVEGMVANSWEVEDNEGAARYLVVTRVSKGTSEHLAGTWLKKVQSKMDAQIGSDRTIYVETPAECITTVLEILPYAETEEEEEIGLY